MPDKSQDYPHSDNNRAINALRAQIAAHPWKESADLVISNIELVAELGTARRLSMVDIKTFSLRQLIVIDTLLKLRDGPYEDERRRLREAVQALTRAFHALRAANPPQEDGREPLSLAELMAWYEHVDQSRRLGEESCRTWRAHWHGAASEQQSAALECIEEIERRIPLLRSRRLADAPEQHDAIAKCMILNCKLGGYAGYASEVEKFAEAIVHNGKRWAAFLEALVRSNWLASRTPSAYLTRVTARIYSQVQPDTNGRDSRGFYHRAGPGGRIGGGDALCGFNRTQKRERSHSADPPAKDHELRFDYAPAGRATLHRREAPKSLSATDERHAHETAQLEGPSLTCPTVYLRGAQAVRTIKRRFGSPEQVEYETLVPATDARAALIPASTATQEDIDNAITISQAVRRAVRRDPETLVEFLHARYVLAWDELGPAKLGKSVPHHKPGKISDNLMTRVLGVDKKAVNARQSRLKYYREAIAAELAGRSARREPPARFISPWELMSQKMQTVMNSGGTLAPRAPSHGTGA